MDKMFEIGKYAVAALGALLVKLFGPWDGLSVTLVVFVVLDYLTGIIGGAIKGELNSSVGFYGLAKKVMIFVIVAVGTQVDKIIPDTNGAVRGAVVMFYIANEGLSILENVGGMGVPLPTVLKGWLDKLKTK